MADDTINLRDVFDAKSSEVEWKAPDTTIDLRPDKLLEQATAKIIEQYRADIEDIARRPKDSTIKRRGQGGLFNVTGSFLSSIKAVVRGGRNGYMEIVGRLSPTVKRLLPRPSKKLVGEAGEAVAKGIVKVKR